MLSVAVLFGCRAESESVEPEVTPEVEAPPPVEAPPVVRVEPPPRLEYEFTAVDPVDEPAEVIEFRDVVVTPDGERGFAVGRATFGGRAVLLELNEGRWAAGTLPTLPSGAQLTDVVTDETGRHAWAIGVALASDVTPLVLRRDDAVWSMDEAALAVLAAMSPTATPSAIALTPDARDGWLFGGDFSEEQMRYVGACARFDGQTWTLHPAPDHQEVFAVWISRDGTQGWAAGRRAGAMTLSDGRWTQTEVLADRSTVGVWFDDSGREGWAVGNHISRFEEGSWATVLPEQQEYYPGLWFHPTGATGFIVGEPGRGAGLGSRWIDGQWAPLTHELLAAQQNYAVALSEDATQGWIVGNGNLIHMVGTPP